MKILICKPGTVLAPRPGKTNLQLREMEFFRTACEAAGIDAEIEDSELITEAKLLEQPTTVVVFAHLDCFSDLFSKLMSAIDSASGTKVVLVSNDCRLKFKLDETTVLSRLEREPEDVIIATNATRHLDQYANDVLFGMKAGKVLNWALWTLPAFNTVSRPEVLPERDYIAVYPCMYAKDYGRIRRQILSLLISKLGDKLLLPGNVEGLAEFNPATVTDTADVQQWYLQAHTAPVVVEQIYDYYGVVPNRVSEAIMNDCMPVAYGDFPIKDVPNCGKAVVGLAPYCESIAEQYYGQSMQAKLAQLRSLLSLQKQLMVQQIYDLTR